MMLPTILIPAYKPEEILLVTADSLKRLGFQKIIVIDDGSGEAYRDIFEKTEHIGCIVLQHIKNKGKGAALKTGIEKSVELFGKNTPVITVDADGQHLPADVFHIAMTMQYHPTKLILGVRDFSGEKVPWKSRFGNQITSRFFQQETGIECPDTQTGLRGIPAGLLKTALETKGDRYEYEMNFLIDAASLVPFEYIPIATVYENDNRASHFRPVQDSIRVYGRFLKYSVASLIGAAVDLSCFHILKQIIPGNASALIITATVLARILSGAVNFTLNKKWSFESKGKLHRELGKYGIVFLSQMLLSAGLVNFFAVILKLGHSTIVKMIVDSMLFLVSYQIQKKWVFKRQKGPRDKGKEVTGLA